MRSIIIIAYSLAYYLTSVNIYVAAESAKTKTIQTKKNVVIGKKSAFVFMDEKEKKSLLVRGGAAAAAAAASGDKIVEKKQLSSGQYSLGRVLEYHKAFWLPVSLGFNYYFQNWSERSCLMAGLFGGYGINWVVKSYTFWDKGFYNDPASIGGIGFVFKYIWILNIFFLFPYVAAKNRDPIKPLEVMVVALLYSIGTLFHYGSDCQKFYTLKYRGTGLISEAFYSKIRSPNYFGENLMFASFVITAGVQKKLAWVPMLLALSSLFSLGSKKSSSLARYEEFEDWKKQTWF